MFVRFPAFVREGQLQIDFVEREFGVRVCRVGRAEGDIERRVPKRIVDWNILQAIPAIPLDVQTLVNVSQQSLWYYSESK